MVSTWVARRPVNSRSAGNADATQCILGADAIPSTGEGPHPCSPPAALTHPQAGGQLLLEASILLWDKYVYGSCCVKITGTLWDTMQKLHNFLDQQKTLRKFQDCGGLPDASPRVRAPEQESVRNAESVHAHVQSSPDFMVAQTHTITFNEVSSSKFFYLWGTQGSEARAFEQDKTWNSRMNSTGVHMEWWVVFLGYCMPESHVEKQSCYYFCLFFPL